MAIVNQVQQIRGTTAQNEGFTGLSGVLSVDLDKKTLRVHDGVTAGGSVLAKEAIKLKTDDKNLLQFNAGTEADHAADITITMDVNAVSSEVITAIKEDEELQTELATNVVETITNSDELKDDTAVAVIAGIEASEDKQNELAELLADNLVSATEGNALKVDETDNKLYVPEMDVEALVKSDDAILSVNDDNEIQTNLTFAYTAVDGKFKVTGKGGATIYEGTIPTSLTILKSATIEENPEGQPAGTYIHFVFDTQAGTEEELYADVSKFIDVYTAGNGLKMNDDDDHKFEIALTAAGNQAKFDGTGGLLVPTDYGTLD